MMCGMNLRAWERRFEIPLVVAAIVFALLYAWQVLVEPRGQLLEWAQIAMTVIWVVFVVDYVVRLLLAPQRGRWFLRHLPDLATVAIPALRPLRLFGLMVEVHRLAGAKLRGKVMLYVSVATVVLVLLSALAMLEAERYANAATIVTFGDALWWAIVTVTSVGYGDLAPVTLTGRVVAAAMMIAGIALLGTVTATLASWLVQRNFDQEETSQAVTQKEVLELTAEIQTLRVLMENLSANLPAPTANTLGGMPDPAPSAPGFHS